MSWEQAPQLLNFHVQSSEVWGGSVCLLLSTDCLPAAKPDSHAGGWILGPQGLAKHRTPCLICFATTSSAKAPLLSCRETQLQQPCFSTTVPCDKTCGPRTISSTGWLSTSIWIKVKIANKEGEEEVTSWTLQRRGTRYRKSAPGCWGGWDIVNWYCHLVASRREKY